MKTASKENYKKFYDKLGHLFYAIAAADNKVRAEEKSMLHKMVEEDWLNLENSQDDFGTDAAFGIEFVFDRLEEKQLTAEQAYEAFESYYQNNPEMFDEDVIRRIYHTASRIADAFHDKNKSEQNLLARIHLLLGGIQ
jgi:hypothetical protein